MIVAFRGHELPSGEFEVKEYCLPGVAPQKPLQQGTHLRPLLLSVVSIGSAGPSPSRPFSHIQQHVATSHWSPGCVSARRSAIERSWSCLHRTWPAKWAAQRSSSSMSLRSSASWWRAILWPGRRIRRRRHSRIWSVFAFSLAGFSHVFVLVYLCACSCPSDSQSPIRPRWRRRTSSLLVLRRRCRLISWPDPRTPQTT